MDSENHDGTPMTFALKLTLTMLSGGLVALGFYLLDWQPRLRQLGELEQAVVERQARCRADRERLKQLPELTRRLQELEAAVPTGAPLAAVVAVEEAVRHGAPVELVEVICGGPRAYRVELRGRYYEVVELLRQMGPAAVERLTLVGQAKAPGESPRLSLSLVTAETGR